jgi:ubiquinone/menaquinone biosynthesis C-methylase UbiE
MSRMASYPRLLVFALTLLATAPGAAQAPTGQASRHTLFPPKDLGLLESPDRDIWQKPEQVMDALGIADGSKVADIGAGSGYFTIRLARRVGPNGVVWAEDVQPAMLEAIKRRVAKDVAKDIRNVIAVNGTSSDPMLPADSVDAVLILDTYQEIVQDGNPQLFLQNVRKALRPGGRVGMIDYKKEGGGPGPDGPRPDPDAVISVAQQAGLRLMKRETFLPFQFFLIFVK